LDQIMLSTVCCILVGRDGRRLGHPDIKSAYTQLFADYYQYNTALSAKTYYKYNNRSTPYPHFLYRHYGAPKDYHRTLGDMMVLMDYCPSLSLLRQIERELYEWVITYLPAEEAKTVCQNYIGQNATRHEIAVFAADVLHHSIQRVIDENRPTKKSGKFWYS